MAASDPASAIEIRFARAIRELLSLWALFEGAPGGERSLLYAQCIPWLTEVRAHTKPPLPVRAITILTREADWHLRCLAGLGMRKASKASRASKDEDEEHAAWALDALEALARFSDLR